MVLDGRRTSLRRRAPAQLSRTATATGRAPTRVLFLFFESFLVFFDEPSIFSFYFFFPPIRCFASLHGFVFAPQIFFFCLRCSLHSRSFFMKDIDRLNKNKEPRGRILGSPKVAATYSPTTQCSTIGDAVSLPSPLSAPLLSALSRARARPRRLRPTSPICHPLSLTVST